MSTAGITGADVRLRDDVVRQLKWDAEVDATAIGVAAVEGAVTLTGYIDTYAGKLAAERAAKRVRGVRAVANEIVVRPGAERSDADIAHDAAQALKLNPRLADHVQATVHNGHVTLTGTVTWLHQQREAEYTIRHLLGVRGVFNHIQVQPRSERRDVQRRITRSLHNHADLDARHVTVALNGDTVILQGQVSSWLQRDAVEQAAGSAPGIVRVDNQLLVVPPEPQDPHGSLDDMPE